MMTMYHAVMLGEDGTEFGLDVEALSKDDAWAQIREDYPEGACLQLESPQDTMDREKAIYDRMNAMWDNPDLDDYGY